MKMKRTYSVVENAGYERERVVAEGFKRDIEASSWAIRHYAGDEMETLHVMIRTDYADGTSEY